MNERIKLLAEQAGLRFTQLMSNPMVPVVDGRETDLAKFAELIVQECLELTLGKDRKQLLDKGDLNSANLVQKDIIRVIKHFGVER